ncbi:TIM-barrel domain-containing protein [Paenibacillus sp. NPDC056579]|uniref:TIM-barrel domain-containing protein n=1 Tax=unclassified Paenibacillus TaxID=185978 RepID=UPI001EF8F610|nr:TIM-barrel domain-containing protein [Paenibacillus sp. H1-7]ULL19282.1 hypothetical protein DVH26_35605 [Paenibacillus sp. H1-7]
MAMEFKAAEVQMNCRHNRRQFEITTSQYKLTIDEDGFRYGLEQPGCTKAAKVEPHARSGLCFSRADGPAPSPAKSARLAAWEGAAVRFVVDNEAGHEADVRIECFERYVRFDITVRGEAPFLVEGRTGPMSPVYGLGDYGSQIDTVATEEPPAHGKLDIPARDRANLAGYRRSDMVNQGTNMRFVSNFAVFPAHRFAAVLFEEGSKRVAFTDTETMLGASRAKGTVRLYYFMGEMAELYADYKRVREAEGYIDKRPGYTMFRVGWEAYGSLGWNSYQSEVQDAIQQYLDRGYDLAWGVIGSGFWKGDRKGKYEGTTTSFNLWDDTYEEGRTDGLANPRFPDVAGLKAFFAERGIKLILGLRNHLKAPEEDGGCHHPVYNGPYLQEALERDYFLRHPEGGLVRITNAQFPSGTVYVLDSRNPEAVSWFVSKAETWEAQGFKEDAMIYTKHYADGNWNKLNEALMDRDLHVIVRNSAYSVPGDLIRINDTYYGSGEGYHFDQDRVPINLLNIAASGASNLYPDITGGTPKTDPTLPNYQRYFVRNAMLNAVTPGMSMGRKPWDMNHPEYESYVKKAADWHNRYSPYIYSAVMEGFRTGYPHAMTPLHIAYADDPSTYELINRQTRQYEWMLGPSMLAAPLYGNDFGTASARDIYLPAGSWIDYETGERFEGPVTLHDYPVPEWKIPVFIGGKGVVVYHEPQEGYMVEVYPTTTAAGQGRKYTHTHVDGITISTVMHGNEGWNPATLCILSDQIGIVPHRYMERTGSYRFPLVPGVHYTIAGGR